MGLLSFQLTKIPDLSLNKYQSLADTGVDGVLKRHESFLRQWHGICAESALSFHLLYMYLPSDSVGRRLNAYFLIQGADDALRLVEPLLAKSPLSDFFTLQRAEVPQIVFNVGATLTKKELRAKIPNPMTGQIKEVHYVPSWEMSNGARLYDLFRIMETVGQAYTPLNACAYRIDLYPTNATSETRAMFSPVLKDLRGENDIKLIRETESLRSDSYARDICKVYEEWLTNIETTPHFRVNLYAFSDSTFKSRVLLNAAGSEALQTGDFSIFTPIRPDANGAFNPLSRLGNEAREYCFYPSNREVLQSWSTTYCLPEVVPFFRFPTLYDGEVIEIPKETAPAYIEDGLYLGKDTNGYPVNIALKDLTRHAFFTGMPGAGKTNTMLHIATQLHKKNIPFLALEPAKKEYRALLANDKMRDVYLFSPHLKSHFPLQVNPMEFPVGVQLSEHINSLLEVFQGSFVLEGPTYKFLSSSIQRAYTDLGWDLETENTPDCTLAYPSLQDVYNNLQKEIDASSYDSEIKGNVRAFLQVRLGGLMERDAGEVFNVQYSTLSPDEWLKVSAIVELETLNEQAKNFFILLVCHYILETLRSNPTGGVDADGNLLPVRHVMFIEEAHNIIASSTEQSGSDSVNPKVSATAYIIKMLAEVRALRESIVIADQLPTALASEVTKNTGLKLVHRLTAKDDREEIGAAISASSIQLERMAAFTSGQAYIYHEKTLKPFEMQVAKWDEPDSSLEISNDGCLYAELCDTHCVEQSVKAAIYNWRAKYLFSLDDACVALLEDYKKANGPVDSLRCESTKAILLAEYDHLLEKLARLKKLWRLDQQQFPALYEEVAEAERYIVDGINGLKNL